MSNTNASQQPIRILVADDDESLRSVIKQVLNGDGFEVVLASSGEEALEIFLKCPCCLVIADIKMSGMSGIELLQEIKKRSQDTEVVIVTSYASLETAVAATKHGAYDYLIKPFEDIQLVSAVAKRAIEKIRLLAENRDLLETVTKKKAELEKANNYLQQMVIRDALTGTYNHRHFQEALVQELNRSARHHHPCSLVFFDIDNFKLYNDTNGHPHGDELLRLIAKAVLGRLRQSDILARYGGEEFVIILPETTREMALKLAERIRVYIAGFPFGGREVMPGGAITVSLGVATYPVDGENAAALIKRADDAMYEAKRAGKNQVR